MRGFFDFLLYCNMDNQKPTLKELETYQRVNAYLNKENKKPYSLFSMLPRPRWLMVVIVIFVSIIFYYGLTTMIFGEEFWANSIMGPSYK